MNPSASFRAQLRSWGYNGTFLKQCNELTSQPHCWIEEHLPTYSNRFTRHASKRSQSKSKSRYVGPQRVGAAVVTELEKYTNQISTNPFDVCGKSN